MEDLSKKLMAKVMIVVANAEKKVSELSEEVSRLTREVNNKNQEYKSLESSLQKKIDDLQTERNGCVFFAFSKKKDLEQAIASANSDSFCLLKDNS